VRVVISHELSYPVPALTGWFAHGIVGGLFVSHIAGLTLARIKQIAEGESQAAKGAKSPVLESVSFV
jgi:hypothetical protein